MRLMLLCCTWKDERMGEEEAGGSLPVCAGCKQRIYDEQYLQALNTDWHTVCFRCCECSASLSHWYYEKDGRLFCKKDYWTKFGELCHGCNDPITTGLIMPSFSLSIRHPLEDECAAISVVSSSSLESVSLSANNSGLKAS